MAQWLGTKRIVFVPMIRPTDPTGQDETYLSGEVFRRVLFDPRGQNRTFSEHVNRASHGRASIDAVFLPARRVPWSDLLYGSTTPNPSESGVDYALDAARAVLGGQPGRDYIVCSIGQGNDSNPSIGYQGVPGVGGTSRPGRGWLRTHIQANIGEYLHETLHVVGWLHDYYQLTPSMGELDPMAWGHAHPTTYTKRLLGWVVPSDVLRHRAGTQNYVIRHQAIFALGASAFGPAALSIAAGGATYYVESRAHIDQFELEIQNPGVIIYKVTSDDTDPGELVAPAITLETAQPLTTGQSAIVANGKISVTVTAISTTGASIGVVSESLPPSDPCDPLRALILRFEREADSLEARADTPAEIERLQALRRNIARLEARAEALGCND